MVLSLDYESRSKVDLPDAGLDLYSADPSTEIFLCAYAFDYGTVHLWDKAEGRPFPREVKEALVDPEVEKAAFNAQFERVMTRRVLGLKTPHQGWRCTMVLGLLNGFSGGLDEMGTQIGLSHDKQKKTEGKRLINKFSKPQKITSKNPHVWRNWDTDPEDWRLFGEYCKQDVVAETALKQKLLPFYVPEWEWQLYEIDQAINDRGLPVDRDFVENAIEMTKRRRDELREQMEEITGLANPNSVAQLLPWLQERGYRYDDLGKDTVVKALNEDEQDLFLSEAAEKTLRLRQYAARMSTRKYNTLMKIIGPGERARFLFQFSGAARTRRWAGRKVQPQNLPHTPKDLEDEEKLEGATEAIRTGDYEALGEYVDEPMAAFVGLIRSSVRAPDGYELAVCDLSSIESCVLAWLSGCKRLLHVFEDGRDPYKDFATELFRKSYDDVTKPERNASKPATLGCGYRMGGGELRNGEKTGLWAYAEKMGIPKTQQEAHRDVELWRETYPEIPKLWYALEEAVARTVTKGLTTKVGYLTFKLEKPFLTMYLPSGGPIRYYQPRITSETRISRRGKPYEKLVLSHMGKQQLTNQWLRMSTHGGKIVEQATQGTARDVLATGMRRAARAGFHLIGSVHDELIALVKKGDNQYNAEGLRAEMIAPLKWAPGLPLGGKAYSASFYRKD